MRFGCESSGLAEEMIDEWEGEGGREERKGSGKGGSPPWAVLPKSWFSGSAPVYDKVKGRGRRKAPNRLHMFRSSIPIWFKIRNLTINNGTLMHLTNVSDIASAQKQRLHDETLTGRSLEGLGHRTCDPRSGHLEVGLNEV